MKIKLFIVSFLWVSMLFAGDTGKIVGQITDSETGEALFGVNILLKGSSIGSASDMEGNYIILNVPAASYTISASYICLLYTSPRPRAQRGSRMPSYA